MTTYKVLYWQEIPSQIKAEDNEDDVTLPFPQKFMERIDKLAAARGLAAADDYLAQWHWSEEQQREGSASEVAETVVAELAAKADW
jgi:Virulence factor